MRIAILIPARFGSTRFPGKPLAQIAGRSMLSRVVDIALAAAQGFEGVSVAVTTDDARIAAHAAEIGAECIMTPESCATGSDRVYQAALQMHPRADFIINLQGDAPFTPPALVRAMIERAVKSNPAPSVITPVQKLGWSDLDRLRENKKTTPFSGTTCIRADDGRAIWFSKAIIPAIRNEDRAQPLSPVCQHIGLYGYSFEALSAFIALPPSPYEMLEGLEQLRFLENGMRIDTFLFEAESGRLHSGIDTPEDLKRAEERLRRGVTIS